MTRVPGINGSVPRRLVLPTALRVARTARGFTVTALCLALLVLAGGGAGAVWRGFATGSGTAETEAPDPVVLSPGIPSGALSPGSTADVVLTVTNPNRSSVHLAPLTLDRTQGTNGFAVDDDHRGCDVSALRFGAGSVGRAGWTVPGKVGNTDGSALLTLADAVGMDPSASDACQGATFSVYLAAGP